MIAAFAMPDAFTRTLWRHHHIRTREHLEMFQRAGVRQLIEHAARKTRAYAGFSGSVLRDLPIIDKAEVLADFAAYNVLGLSVADISAAIETGQIMPGLEFGRSTGTTGTRGFYVISQAERYRWLGTILAKILPDVLIRRHRVAIVLPGPSLLYQSANQSRVLRLEHFDVTQGIPALQDAIATFGPSVLLAAPKSLRLLAADGRIRPKKAISAAEIADPTDLTIVEEAFSLKTGHIYMATEGLFGTSCSHGRLHLAEDVAVFETYPVAEDPTLVTALVTDFTRRTQVTARYAMGDVMRLHSEVCQCGSPMRVVTILGREHDLLRPRSLKGGRTVLAPDHLRNAITNADPSITDYRIAFNPEGQGTMHVMVDKSVAPAVTLLVDAALRAHLAEIGAVANVRIIFGDLRIPFDRKLRKIVNISETS